MSVRDTTWETEEENVAPYADNEMRRKLCWMGVSAFFLAQAIAIYLLAVPQ